MGYWDQRKQRLLNKYGLGASHPAETGIPDQGLMRGWAQRDVKDLVGTRQQPYQMDEAELFPGEAQATLAPGLMTKGTGYIGTIDPQRSPEKLAQAELFGGLMSVPGSEQIGAQGMQGMFGREGLMARQQAAADIAESAKEPTYGQFKNYDQYLKARQSLRKEWNPQLAPSRESIRKYNQATDIVTKRKGYAKMTGADDTVLIKGFASMILPGEAVMEGDIATIVNQAGLPGTLQSYLQAFKGEGQLGTLQRQEIYNAMTGLAERANKENLDIRAQMQPDIIAGQFDQRGLFRSPLEYSPYKSVAPPPPGKVKRQIR